MKVNKQLLRMIITEKYQFIQKQFITLLFLIFSFTTTKGQEKDQITIGKIKTIHSNILGEKREIWIHAPEDAGNGRHYPVVYLLDGNAHFSSVVGLIDFMSSNSGGNKIPEMIVVGILNTDRMRDLSPTHIVEAPPYITRDAAKTSGGGEAFLSFLEKELIPYIDYNYPTAPYKMLIGHSLGGLMVMETVMKHTNMFNSYISIDPSMWWDNNILVKEMAKSLPSKKTEGVSLYLACANTMPKNLDITTVRNDTSMTTEHIRAILQTNDLLNNAKKSNLKYGFKYYKDDSHNSVPLIAEYDAFRFIFDYYPMNEIDDNQIWDKNTINIVEKHYANLSRQLGYTIKVPEDWTNSHGYRLLGEKKYDEAEYLFQMNINNYPDSSNVYDSMGDYYLARGEKDKALANFKKALSIDSTVEETKAKLEALLKQ